MKTDKNGNEVLEAGKGFATFFASYNTTSDGSYIKDWDSMLHLLQSPKVLDINIDDFLRLKKTDAKAALRFKFANGCYDTGACPMVRNIKTGDIKPSRSAGVPRPDKYNLVVLDADSNLSADFDDKVKTALSGYEFFNHATISSKAGSIRRRIVIPLAEPVSLDTREAFIRYIANQIGMESIDASCVRSKQLMVLPVHCKNADTYSYHGTGKLMDTSWLPADYHNCASWPRWNSEADTEIVKRSKRERKVFVEQGKFVPVRDGNKIHDAFNRAYSISEILKDNGYVPGTVPGRWSHTYDDCADGIKVTNDSILYSYYGTDRLSVQRDLDSFETALVLRYGDISVKDNWKRMIAESAKDDRVKAELLAELPFQPPADAASWALLYDTTEEGIAQRCAAYFPHKVVNGQWWRYQGGIYRPVKEQAMLTDALAMIRVAAALQPDREELADMIGKVNTGRNIVKAWYSLALEATKPDMEWEPNQWLIHFTDCVIDLKAWCEGRVNEYRLEHSPEYLMTESTGYAFHDVENVDPKAMDEIMQNMVTYLPDEKVRDYFQMSMGRALVGGIAATEDKCLWLMGPDGGNGKSTVLDAIKGAMGTYYYDMKGSYLYYSSKQENSEAPTPELAGMMGKRFVNFCEYNGIRTLDGEKYKNYTSAGWIKARRLNSDSNSFRSRACVCIDCNGMPGLQKKESAIFRRTRIIGWYTKLVADGRVKDRWMNNHKLHVAMMAWLMLGLQMWYANGMCLDKGLDDKALPHDIWQECTEFFNSFDSPEDFFEDFYIITNDKNDFLIADEAWEQYCQQVYDRGASRHAFRQTEARWLRQNGITEKHKRDIGDGTRLMCYVGVKLRKVDRYSSYGRYSTVKAV